MNVGLMFSFRNSPKWKKPWQDVYETQLGQIRLAEELVNPDELRDVEVLRISPVTALRRLVDRRVADTEIVTAETGRAIDGLRFVRSSERARHER